MASGTDYAQEYQQAEKAYLQGNYEQAATLVDRLVEQSPNDPSTRLLRGHIYCYGLQRYDVAREQYELVLKLTSEPEFIDYANNGLEYALTSSTSGDNAYPGMDTGDIDASYQNPGNQGQFGEETAFSFGQDLETGYLNDFSMGDLDFGEPIGDDNFQDQELYQSFGNPFNNLADESIGTDAEARDTYVDPFAFGQSQSEHHSEEMLDAPSYSAQPSWESPDLLPINNEESLDENLHIHEETLFINPSEEALESDFAMPLADTFDTSSVPSDFFDGEDDYLPYEPESQVEEGVADYGSDNGNTQEATHLNYLESDRPVFEDETLLMRSGQLEDTFAAPKEDYKYTSQDASDETDLYALGGYSEDETQHFPSHQNGSNSQDRFDFDAFDEAFGNDISSIDPALASDPESGLQAPGDQSRAGFLDAFDEFDDFGSIPDFDVANQEGIPSSGAPSFDFGMSSSSGAMSPPLTSGGVANRHSSDTLSGDEDGMFGLTSTTGLKNAAIPEQVATFTRSTQGHIEPSVTVEQNWLAPFENASLNKKQWIGAAAAGIVSALTVATVSFVSSNVALKADKPEVISHLHATGLLMALAAGVGSFGTTLFLGRVTTKQISRATSDLQTQFEEVSQGNLNANATVYSEDEFGRLATGFNQMARVILTTTSEAQRKAQEQEQQKEDLQRQVIRLLDDVEGAARGDLTVQAEVTADVLGAVADSFNLTIANLREIVQQVKPAAREVNKGATDSEAFARGLSSDALRQAEELAVTLNSVQVMTDSIKRVAESAREAEEVARAASATALRGGEAVERTVAGILEIRETVAETTRKVKRLAESTQEIAKIVALISQIASRTNLLALNASIEAARAGEAGRGFAIVADEVRQLADRSAKSLKEIEQIVMQIQYETGSVMTAMEEGTQQVIHGTRLAEQAKRSLDEIIQVNNRIDALVRSITADTVEQTETSQAVAQVMQSVELTAQETSQEAQRVSGALQNLLIVARDLLTSVERFKVEATDGK